MIYLANFKVKAEHDLLVPPFTSKVSRSILSLLSPSYAKVSEDKRPYKPVRVTVLKGPKGPVISLSDKKAIIKGNQEYYFSFTFTDHNIAKEIMKNDSTQIKLWDTKMEVELTTLKVIEEIGYEEGKFYKVYFLTPTLLQPPKKVRENRFLLYPYSFFLLSSIVRHWNANMSEKIDIHFSDSFLYLKEIDHEIRPVTANYDGKPVRGFWGWIIYEVGEEVKKLLTYANYFGIGKSRAIGFGEVIVTPVFTQEKTPTYNTAEKGNHYYTS